MTDYLPMNLSLNFLISLSNTVLDTLRSLHSWDADLKWYDVALDWLPPSLSQETYLTTLPRSGFSMTSASLSP